MKKIDAHAHVGYFIYIDNNNMEIDMIVSDLLEQAKREVGNVADGQEFLVKDLFMGHFWNSLPRSDRGRLGELFFEYAKTDGDPTPLGKTSAHQQKYVKKSK